MNDYRDVINMFSEIYNCFEDYLSKEIFLERMKYNLQRSKYQIEPLLKLSSDIVYESYSKLKADTNEICNYNEGILIIYGAGSDANYILQCLEPFYDSKSIIFCDKNSHKINRLKGFPVISPDLLIEKYNNCKIMIATSRYEDEVKVFLMENGWEERNIFIAHSDGINFTDPSQYFPADIIQLRDDEVFIDCGAFDGATSLELIKRCNNKYMKIFAFEPDTENYLKVSANLQGLTNCYLQKCGLWDKKDTLFFIEDNNMISRISNIETSIRINTERLDDLLSEEAVSFIKMDIEGAEQKAILGATETITRCKPRLAICVYHDYSVILEVCEYLRKIVPEYKFYLRHHSISLAETVLYAIL